jgi:hypothetical protein
MEQRLSPAASCLAAMDNQKVVLALSDDNIKTNGSVAADKAADPGKVENLPSKIPCKKRAKHIPVRAKSPHLQVHTLESSVRPPAIHKHAIPRRKTSRQSTCIQG